MESMKWLLHIFSLFLLCFTGVSSTETLAIYEPNSSHHDYPLAVSVSNQDLKEVSSSVLMAETWLRTHVLAFYPSSKITHIVVGHNLLCFSQSHHHFHDLILPTLKNLHHSLTRWGLEREIKVSPSLSSHCLTPNLSLTLIKPILHFIQTTNSTYLVNPLEPISENNPKIEPLFSPHFESLKKLGFLSLEKINLVMKPPKQAKSQSKATMRKLSSLVIPPLPAENSLSPAQTNFPIARGPLPPLVGSTSFPPTPFSEGPGPSPGPTPCNPWAAAPPMAAAPAAEEREKLWCVAKPSVPAETLQEAMDYACGEGGADCEEIQQNGNCFYPESLVAHASFAFNSYWQNTKNHGGTCSFGGTAMLINSDPSFLHCRFIVS